MRRIGAIVTGLIAAAALLASAAAATDERIYEIEMYNAFGVVEGSDVRIAGVNAGIVESIDVNAEKHALLKVKLSGPLSELGDETTCASEPSSLIAEYFVDCDPAGDPMPPDSDSEADIPAERVAQTVQLDLLFNTFREPYVDRLRILIDELGTGLAGNPEQLSEALRLAFPALTELRETTKILARQRRRLTSLNVDANRVIGELARGKEDVTGAISEARDTAVVAADRSGDLRRGAELTDDVLAELEPTLESLGDLGEAGTPVLDNLLAAAPSLTGLTRTLPPFAASAADSLVALGKAAGPGTEALTRGADEIRSLKKAARNAPLDGEILADLLSDIDDPSRTVEIDARAARTCEDKTLPCYGTGRAGPTGYTGMEALLNYIYYQTGAINQFDSVGHLLQFNVYDAGTGPCATFNPGPDVPAAGGGRTTDILEADPCVSWLGANQADISYDLGLGRYDNSVCPHGSTDLELCDPEISIDPLEKAPWDDSEPSGGDGSGSGSPLPLGAGAAAGVRGDGRGSGGRAGRDGRSGGSEKGFGPGGTRSGSAGGSGSRPPTGAPGPSTAPAGGRDLFNFLLGS